MEEVQNNLVNDFPKVLVLMSSYNGEQYIKEQINSILAQDKVKVELLIRDDGSSDGTLKILEQYAKTHENVHIEYGTNIGACKSFLTLLYDLSSNYTFEYLAFSDQDDIWEQEKLKRGVEKIGETDKETLYFSPLNYFNDFTGETSLHKNAYLENFFESLLISTFPGCTFILNRLAYNYLMSFKKPQHAIMHDWFIYQVMSGENKRIIYDDHSFINYRIHGDNFSVLSNNPLERIKRVWKLSAGRKWDRLGMARELNNCGLKLNVKDQKRLDLICDYKQYKREVVDLVRHTRLSAKYKLIFIGAFLFNIY